MNDQRPAHKRRPRNNKKRYNNKNRSSEKKAQSSANKNNGQNSGPPRKRHRNNRRGPRQTIQEKVAKRYHHLLETHIQARRKYYDLFNLADPNQKAKLERQFERSLRELREFEQGLRPNEKEVFDKYYGNWGELDLTYASNHGLPPYQGEIEVSPEEIEDPHYLESQKEANYRDDTTEDVGTYEDYLRYKGLDSGEVKKNRPIEPDKVLKS